LKFPPSYVIIWEREGDKLYCSECGTELPKNNNHCSRCDKEVWAVVHKPYIKGRPSEGLSHAVLLIIVILFLVISGGLFFAITSNNNSKENISQTTTVDLNASINLDNIKIYAEFQDFYNEKGKQKIVIWVRNNSGQVFSGTIKAKVLDDSDLMHGFEFFYPENIQPGMGTWGIIWARPGGTKISYEIERN